jgi:hypothetical protein
VFGSAATCENSSARARYECDDDSRAVTAADLEAMLVDSPLGWLRVLAVNVAGKTSR